MPSASQLVLSQLPFRPHDSALSHPLPGSATSYSAAASPPVRLKSLLKIGLSKTASFSLLVRFLDSQSRHLLLTPHSAIQ